MMTRIYAPCSKARRQSGLIGSKNGCAVISTLTCSTTSTSTCESLTCRSFVRRSIPRTSMSSHSVSTSPFLFLYLIRWTNILRESELNRLRFWVSSFGNKKTLQMEENEFHYWPAQAKSTCQLHRGQCSQMREILPIKHKEWPSLSYARSHS